MSTGIFASLRSRLLLLIALAILPALGLIFYVNVEQRRLAANFEIGVPSQSHVLRPR